MSVEILPCEPPDRIVALKLDKYLNWEKNNLLKIISEATQRGQKQFVLDMSDVEAVSQSLMDEVVFWIRKAGGNIVFVVNEKHPVQLCLGYYADTSYCHVLIEACAKFGVTLTNPS